MSMKLELLPNELLLEILDYVDDVERLLVCSLNARLKGLLSIRSKRYCLNFHSVTKQNLDRICRQFLPKMLDRIVTLHLSDDDDTPNQITQFFSYGFSLLQMTHLTTLSIFHLRRAEILNKILSQLFRVRQLTSLKIEHIHFGMEETDQFMRIIWSLPKLTHFHIAGESFRRYCCLPELTIFAPFKRLYMMDSSFTAEQLCHLLECAVYLEHLSISVHSKQQIFDASSRSVSPSLTVLKIAYTGKHSLEELRSIFPLLPNLRELEIEIDDLFITGNQWGAMIRSYLSKLTIFRLLMSFAVTFNGNMEHYVVELLESFRTPFWLSERQIFFRCQWQPKLLAHQLSYSMQLYTLPYGFETFNYGNLIRTKSTCPSEAEYWFYNRVNNLNVAFIAKSIGLSCSLVRFVNIVSLTIGNEIEMVDKICLFALERLTTLHLYHLHDRYQAHLQALLDRAPRLNTLIFEESHSRTFFVNNASVRRLIIRDKHFYDVAECVQLCATKLFQQCEVLEMNLRTYGSLFRLLRKIPHIHVILFKCQNEQQWKNRAPSLSKQNELVQWLRSSLPLDSWIHREEDKRIRLWIR